MLRVLLLGPVALEYGETADLRVRNQPPGKVLTWLALHANTFTDRARLAGFLWPDSRDEAAGRSLRTALHQLRKLLRSLRAEQHLRDDGATIGLFDVHSDLTEFRALCDAGEIAQALELVRGHPLAQLDASERDWIGAKRSELLSEIDAVYASHARNAALSRNHGAVAETHERRLALDHMNERALCGLARALCAQDRPRVALGHIEAFQRNVPELGATVLDLKQRIEAGLNLTESADNLPEEVDPYAPSASYMGSGGFQTTFNADLTADMQSTGNYFFRGISAKYVPPRLMFRGPGLETVRVMVVDPAASEAVRLRAADRFSNPKYGGRDLQSLMADLREEVIRSLVGLFDCRFLAPVDVALAATTAVDRIELLDDSCYVAYYHGPRSIGHAFPETQRFEKRAARYAQQRMDCLRSFELAPRKLYFRASHDDAEFIEMLSHHGVMLREQDLDRYRNAADEFTQGFLRQLNDQIPST